MARILSQNEIILNTLDQYRVSKPSLDTKFGTVARDLLVDGPATQLATLYQELARVRTSQSIRLSFGSDLDKLGQNYGEVRKKGSTSFGTAILTFNSIESDIPINKDDIIVSNNGSTFVVTVGVTVSAVFSNTYRAVASKYRADLDFVGITDEYAVEVSVQSTVPGSIGNISKYSLVSTVIPGVSNVTNAVAFGGGFEAEKDAQFKNRILAKFSGANTGTALGYANAVLADPAALDAIVVGPGDPLMTRDGTQVVTSEDGTKTIVSEGTGGKVDIYVYGLKIVQILDSYIYRDRSNRNDPTNPKNDYVLGQIADDANKTVTAKRVSNLEAGILPNQPVNNIVQVSGSSSGPNFAEKQVDSLGRVTGNYELIRDTGSYSGSPWGFDRLHWISNKISGFSEDQTKGKFNGKDPLIYSDAMSIGGAVQNIQVSNENSKVDPRDRTSIQLAHYPVSNVSRVFNLTTGERYVVASQNPDGTGLNTNGRIVIRGNTLPATSDVLQVDYTWVLEYDNNIDFDNLVNGNNPRPSDDSIDWGFSNAVRREAHQITADGLQKQVLVTHPVGSVISVNTFVSYSGQVGIVSGRLAITIQQPPLPATQYPPVENVVSVVRDPDGSELYATAKNDGSFSGFVIYLPTDTVAQAGNNVDLVYNADDVYTVGGVSGSFSDNVITLPTSPVLVGVSVECNYISNVRTILPSTIMTSLPAIRSIVDPNTFTTLTSSEVGTQPVTNVYGLGGITQNLRQAPSTLQITISGSISPGVITVMGNTTTKMANAVITVSNAGLTHDLSSAIKRGLGLLSSDTVPSNIEVIRVISAKKVTTTGSLDVISEDYTYDIKGYQLRNNKYFMAESVENSSLNQYSFRLPETLNNLNNQLKVSDRLLITFYIVTKNDTENVSFSKSGTLYTNKVFADILSVNKSSGFTSASSLLAALSISNQNQPVSGSRYNVIYDYLAPKANERISISYNQNRLIADSTLNIESVRPINADALVRDSIPILVNATLTVVVSKGYENSRTIVQQNVHDAVVNIMNANNLGTILDSSDLVNAAYTVDGVDRVRVTYFNINGKPGMTLSVEAQKNERIQANNVVINMENR